MRTLTIVVPPERTGATVKSMLSREGHMADILISRIKLRETGILLNGVRAFTNARVSAGDILTFEVGDIGGRNEAEPMECPLDFLYEDEDLAVLNKLSGMAVHGGTGEGGCTVANALAALWGQDRAFHPVSRLDRGTSGLMVIAESAYVHDLLRRSLHTENMDRQYLALCRGIDLPDSGRVELPIAKVPEAPTMRCVSAEGQSARTDYRVLSRGKDASLLRLKLYTGRTHQIRVHMAALGCPLLGDELYGTKDKSIGRTALHSAFLTLRHPVTGSLLELSAPLPQDMRECAAAHGIPIPSDIPL